MFFNKYKKEGLFMEKLFGHDNKFFGILEKITDIIILNLLFISFSIPIITIGASITATYSVVMKIEKKEDVYVIREFIKRFRENFKISTIIWILLLLIGMVLTLDFYICNLLSNDIIRNMSRLIFTTISIIFICIYIYIFPVISKFENTIKNTIVNATFMSIQNLPYTLIMILVNLSPIIFLYLFSSYWGYILFFYTVIGFGIIFYINSIFLNKILEGYIY